VTKAGSVFERYKVSPYSSKVFSQELFVRKSTELTLSPKFRIEEKHKKSWIPGVLERRANLEGHPVRLASQVYHFWQTQVNSLII